MIVSEIIDQHNKGVKFSNLMLHNADFTALNLQGIVFNSCDLSFSIFAGADLTNADFSGCNLTGCNFSGAVLRNATFTNANLSRANISHAAIENTNFRGANFAFAHLCGNDLMKADLDGAALDWSCLIETKLTEQQLAAAPENAIISITPAEHDYKLAAVSYEIKKLSGYSAGSNAYSGNSGDVKYNPNEAVGLDPTREINPAFWKKKKDAHKEY